MSELQMRHIDRLPFIFAAILFLLAWLLGLPMRAQSSPLEGCPMRGDAARYFTRTASVTRVSALFYVQGPKSRKWTGIALNN